MGFFLGSGMAHYTLIGWVTEGIRSGLYGSGLHSRQIFGVWFGAKCEWGEEKKAENNNGKGFLVLDSERNSK